MCQQLTQEGTPISVEIPGDVELEFGTVRAELEVALHSFGTKLAALLQRFGNDESARRLAESDF